MIKVLYAGSPQAAADTLKILIQNSSSHNFKIVGVLTNPPAAKGRHKELVPTPVEQTAKEFSTQENPVPVFSPEHLTADVREKIIPLEPDILVCFAYGHIFGPKFMSMFRFGGINLHPSLLPKYRGCSPVPAAILNRDNETAFTIQTLVQEMDAGNILAQEKVSLDGTETSESLLNECAVKGAEMISTLLSEICQTNSLPQGKAQEGTPSYTKTIQKEDGQIDWTSSAEKIDAKIRAYFPEPGCFCQVGTDEKPETLRILEAKVLNVEKPEFKDKMPGTVLAYDKPTGIWIKTGSGILCVTKLQRQGKNAMGYKDFMNGTRNFAGTLLK
ncbi:MAG: methionyl-tRNA formyltransferase [Treponema sp.]